MGTKKSIGLIILALVLNSCNTTVEPCVEEKFGSAIVNSFPDSIQAGVEHNLKIQYIIENSCGSFVEFEDTVIGATTSVKVKLLYDGCNCALQFTEDSTDYVMKQDTAGQYIYKFYLGNSDYDTYYLNVFE